MINYSTCMRGNPTDKDAAKKAYANAQYSQVMTLDKFCYHIASHGCVYSRADIQAILILAVDCLREQLLNGQQIQMGDLGVFSNSIRSLGAHSMAEFTVDNITEVNVLGLRASVSTTCAKMPNSNWFPHARQPPK